MLFTFEIAEYYDMKAKLFIIDAKAGKQCLFLIPPSAFIKKILKRNYRHWMRYDPIYKNAHDFYR
jgi:hypothetical protein